MTSLKRLVFLAVASVMVASLFSGCTGKEKTQQQTTQEVSQTEAKMLEPVTIEYLAYAPVAEPDPNSEIAKTIEKKFNVKFNYWFVDDQKWEDILNVRLASGEMPDVMRFKGNQASLDRYVAMGVLSELTEEAIRKGAPNYAKIADKYDPGKISIWNSMKTGGKKYGFSNINLDGSYPSAFFYRGDWLKNLGIANPPETLKDFETVMYRFRNEDPDKNGKKDTYGMSTKTFSVIFGAFGISEPKAFDANAKTLNIMLRDGKIVYSGIQPEAKEALAYLQKWYNDSVIDPEFITGENKGGYWALTHSLINGRVGVSGGVQFYHVNPPLSEGDLGSQNYQEFKKINPNAEIVLGKPPVGPAGKSGIYQAGIVGDNVGITTKGAKNPRIVDVIFKMLDASFSEDMEYQALLHYGTKDVDYNVNKDGVYVNMLKTPADARKKGIGVFNLLTQNPETKKKFNPPLYKYADQYFKYPGFIGPSVPSTDAVLKYNETLLKLTNEAYIKIISGEKPISTFDDFVKQFRSNGGDECEKAMTDAYNKVIGK